MKKSRDNLSKPLTSINIYLLLILVFAGTIRIYQSFNFPLSGDEVGVGVLQATGHALDYEQRLPVGNFPVSKAQAFISYENNHGIKGVLDSLTNAGMHPPFYYIIIHYIIELMGNGSTYLRLVSVIFSLLSIYIMYLLGNIIYNQKVGLCSALLLAISPYCTHYSVMVRPYPLLMTLGLLSTLDVYLIINNEKMKFKNANWLIYIILSSIGIYTMYNYLFIILSQFIFVLLSKPKSLKSISHTCLIYLIIAITYIPWLPSLKKQLKVVNEHTFYFHDKVRSFDLLTFVSNTIRRNFIRDPSHIFPQSGHAILAIVIAFLVVIIFFIGLWRSTFNTRSRTFTVSLISYFAITIVGGKVMHMNTISWEKFQFFLIPMLFLILANGLQCLPHRLYIKNLSITIICFFLILSSFSTVKAKVIFDGPYTIPSFRKTISASVKQNNKHKILVILNTNQRRYLFPLIQGMDRSIDIAILQNKNNITRDINNIRNMQSYGRIFVCDFLVNRNRSSRFTKYEANTIVTHLIKNNFSIFKVLLQQPGGTLISFSPRSVVRRNGPST